MDEAFLLRYFAPGENQPSPGSVTFSQEKFLIFNVDYTGAINKPYQIWESYKPPFPVATPENFLVSFLLIKLYVYFRKFSVVIQEL